MCEDCEVSVASRSSCTVWCPLLSKLQFVGYAGAAMHTFAPKMGSRAAPKSWPAGALATWRFSVLRDPKP